MTLNFISANLLDIFLRVHQPVLSAASLVVTRTDMAFTRSNANSEYDADQDVNAIISFIYVSKNTGE